VQYIIVGGEGGYLVDSIDRARTSRGIWRPVMVPLRDARAYTVSCSTHPSPQSGDIPSPGFMVCVCCFWTGNHDMYGMTCMATQPALLQPL
jgi:hypothetical protein